VWDEKEPKRDPKRESLCGTLGSLLKDFEGGRATLKAFKEGMIVFALFDFRSLQRSLKTRKDDSCFADAQQSPDRLAVQDRSVNPAVALARRNSLTVWLRGCPEDLTNALSIQPSTRLLPTEIFAKWTSFRVGKPNQGARHRLCISPGVHDTSRQD